MFGTQGNPFHDNGVRPINLTQATPTHWQATCASPASPATNCYNWVYLKFKLSNPSGLWNTTSIKVPEVLPASSSTYPLSGTHLGIETSIQTRFSLSDPSVNSDGSSSHYTFVTMRGLLCDPKLTITTAICVSKSIFGIPFGPCNLSLIPVSSLTGTLVRWTNSSS